MPMRSYSVVIDYLNGKTEDVEFRLYREALEFAMAARADRGVSQAFIRQNHL